jgi:hypothetical protein
MGWDKKFDEPIPVPKGKPLANRLYASAPASAARG